MSKIDYEKGFIDGSNLTGRIASEEINIMKKNKICTVCKKNKVAKFGFAGSDIDGNPVALCSECSAEMFNRFVIKKNEKRK